MVKFKVFLVLFVVLFLFPSPTLAFDKLVPIYTYHYIGFNPNPGKDAMRDSLTTSPEDLEADLKEIKAAGKTTIFFDDYEKPINEPVILTFDDGYVDFYINAYPLLRKYNLKATQFIITGSVGKSNYLTWEMIEDMQKSGLVSFQAHTVTHPNLTLLPYEKTLKEMINSKQELEEKLKTKVEYFAYPYGANNKLTQLAAKEAGFTAAVSTWFGTSSELNLNMPRLKIN